MIEKLASYFFITIVWFITSLYWRRKMDEGMPFAKVWFYFYSIVGLIYSVMFVTISFQVR